MPIGISPLVDYSFKKLFGSQPDIAILIHFLNAVLVGQPTDAHRRYPDSHFAAKVSSGNRRNGVQFKWDRTMGMVFVQR